MRNDVAAEELAERAAHHDLALAEDGHAIAHGLDVAQRMWVEKKIGPPAIALVDDEVAHLLAADRIEAAHRLVEDEQLRIGDERRREAGALEHALRERAHRAIDGVGDAHALEHLASRAREAARRCRPESRPQSVTNSRGVRYG